MKKALAGLFVVCIVIVTLLAVINLAPSVTPKKKNHPQESPAQPVVDTAEEIINRAKPAPALVPIEIAEPSAGESKSPNLVSEPSPPMEIDADQAPTTGKIPPQPAAITSSQQVDNQPALYTTEKPSEGSGLLTDTTETDENQIIDPHSTQVTAVPPKPVKKR